MANNATRLVRVKMLVYAAGCLLACIGFAYFRSTVPTAQQKSWWFDPIRDLELAIFPLGLSILFWEFFIRGDRDQEIIEHVNRALASPLSKLDEFEQKGLIAIRGPISNIDLSEFLKPARHKISVLVPFFIEPNALEDVLKEKLAIRNFVIEIILMEPDSPFLRQRSKIVFKSEDAGRVEVIKTMRMLKRAQEECTKKRAVLQIKLCNSLPSLFIARCDERALFGFYLHGGSALKYPHIEVQLSNEKGGRTLFGSMIEDEFNNVGDARFSRLVSEEDLTRFTGKPDQS